MIKVGLCGVGFMGKMHAACYDALSDAKIVAVADVQADEAKKVAEKHGARVFSKAEDLIADADVDVVDICLPTYMHADHTVLAAQRGLNILCEKPMAYNLAEANRMVKAVRQAKVKFMVAHVIRFWPEYQVLKEYADKKKLGALASVVLRRYAAEPTGWKAWFKNARLSRGATLDLHIHDADYVRYLCGEPKGIDSIGAFSKGAWNQISTNYAFSKVAVTAEGGWWPAGEPFEMNFRAVFQKGVLLYSSKNQPLTLFQEGKEPVQLDVPQPKTGPVQAGGNISSLGGYFNEIQYFTQCLQRGKDPVIVTPEDARDTIALVEKEIASAAKKSRK